MNLDTICPEHVCSFAPTVFIFSGHDVLLIVSIMFCNGSTVLETIPYKEWASQFT